MENKKYIYLDTFGEKLSTFKFYTSLLKSVQEYYHSEDYDKSPPVITFSSRFFIDSSVLPLFAGLGLYLKKFHKAKIDLVLTNTPETINLINFLDKSDFFHIVGDNNNPIFPLGKEIFNFDKAYIGGYSGYIKNEIRIDHKLRCYSQDEHNINEVLSSEHAPEIKRDYLLEYFKGRVENDFYNIFEDKELLSAQKRTFSNIIAELAVNGIFHSESPVFVMAQSKSIEDKEIVKYITTISVVDIGIGFYESLQRKNEKDFNYFKKNEIINLLKLKNKKFENTDLGSIFEIFCYSLIQKREGLFDLLINTFIASDGSFQGLNYFRIHNNSCQLIISYKFKSLLFELKEIRQNIRRCYFDNEIQKIVAFANSGKSKIIQLAIDIVSEYSSNIQVSSLRLFDVEFPGIHIELDIIEKEI